MFAQACMVAYAMEISVLGMIMVRSYRTYLSEIFADILTDELDFSWTSAGLQLIPEDDCHKECKRCDEDFRISHWYVVLTCGAVEVAGHFETACPNRLELWDADSV